MYNDIVRLALLRYAAGPMVWLSIILGVTLLLTASGLFWYRYNNIIRHIFNFST